MNAADVVVRCLIEENVGVVFGYPGGALLPLYEALRSNRKLNHILVRQEQAAAHAASGFARISGKVGVCIGTSGPGATNLITGIATAYMDSIPMVIITGQVNTALIGKDVFQEVDITGATEPFTKHNYLVKNAEDLPRVIKEAFHIASTGRPGPVLIDLPVDVQATKMKFEYPKDVSMRGYKPTERGHIGQVKRAWKLIRESRRPLVLAGGGVILAHAEKELAEFLEKTGLPAVHTLMGYSCLPTDHPNNFDQIGSHGWTWSNKALEQADLLLIVGARLADRSTAGIRAGVLGDGRRHLIHIDIDPAEIGKNVGTDIPLVGNLRHILPQLNGVAERLDTKEWTGQISEWKQAGKPVYEMGKLVNPKFAIKTLSDLMDDRAILVADVGQNQFWSARHFHLHGERRFITSGGLGTMGYSIPAAEGAKFAAPDRQVFAVMGDGSFHMSMFEFGTISANKLPLKMLLFNNGKLGMVRELQDNRFGDHYGVLLDGNPDFVKIAEAYGFQARRVEKNADLEKVMREALQHDGPFLIECIVDAKETTL